LIRDDAELELQIIATGMHLSPEFGLTYRQIEEDGFRVDRKVEMLVSSDTPVGIAKSMGLGMIGMADALNDLRPDLLVILGDRFEIFAAAAAALVARIPVAHLHGGEKTEGAFDEALRHAITKMSHLHFRRRRGISPPRHPVGRSAGTGASGGRTGPRQHLPPQAPGSRGTLEQTIDCRLGEKSLLITFHPATLENATAADQMAELLAALEPLARHPAPLHPPQRRHRRPRVDPDGAALRRRT
jgi:GDP/UDP-N,N'-diacetylbacillosamine 2-epimerase (hydrolysing)